VNSQKFISIGTILKPHGVRGVLKFIADYDFSEDFLKANVLYLQLGSEKNIPYIIETFEEIKRKEYLVKFEDVNTKEFAEKLVKKEVFITENLFEKWITEDEYNTSFSYIIGFNLLNEKQELIGKIEDVIDLTSHEIAQVFVNSKEVLVPLQESLILEIDEEKKQVVMNIPEGLLEIYL
jgi:16S rRNA processing protein RimM